MSDISDICIDAHRKIYPQWPLAIPIFDTFPNSGSVTILRVSLKSKLFFALLEKCLWNG